MVASGDPDVAVGDILNSPTINRLRSEYADMTLRTAEVERRFGADHPARLKAKAEIESVRQLLREEIGRVAEGAKSDVEIARSRQASLEESFEVLKKSAMHTSESQIRLRELERQAASSRDLYQHMLARLQETSQGVTLPSAGARVIERASAPLSAVWPDTRLILVLSAVLGGSLAIGVAITRELLDDHVRTEDDVEALTGSTCLGLVPHLKFKASRGFWSDRSRPSPCEPPLKDDDRSVNYFGDTAEPLHRLLDDRASNLAHVLRTVRLTAGMSDSEPGAGQCLVFSSAYSGEGKSTLAALQALFIAKTGARTLLIDADTTNPALTRKLTPDIQHGLVDAVFRTPSASSVSDLIWTDPATGLDLLPCRCVDDMEPKREIFGSDTFALLLQRLKREYDFIILDLPPLLVLPDARTVANCIDHIIYVVEWGSTDRKAITDALRRAPEIAKRVSGCILNKADERRIKRYGAYYYRDRSKRELA
jgi:succinoglycan biosynthesis transport protein ExoP